MKKPLFNALGGLLILLLLEAARTSACVICYPVPQTTLADRVIDSDLLVALLFVKGSALVQQRAPRFTLWQRYLPIASALVITVPGVVPMTEAAMSVGL